MGLTSRLKSTGPCANARAVARIDAKTASELMLVLVMSERLLYYSRAARMFAAIQGGGGQSFTSPRVPARSAPVLRATPLPSRHWARASRRAATATHPSPPLAHSEWPIA